MAFQQFLSLEDLTDAEANQLKEHCYRGYVEIESHYLFHGKDEDSYSKVTFWLRGVQYHFRRHHLSLFLHMREEGKTECTVSRMIKEKTRRVLGHSLVHLLNRSHR